MGGSLISHDNLILLELVAQALHPDYVAKNAAMSFESRTDGSVVDWSKVYSAASATKVTSLVYDVVRMRDDIPKDVLACFKKDASQMLQISYKLWLTTRFICKKIEDAGIPVVVLKGPVVSAYFPTAEYRKSGDIDIVVPSSKMQEVGAILEKMGYEFERETAPHIEYSNHEGIEVEVHRLMSEPLPDERANKLLEEMVSDGLNRRTFLSLDGELKFPVFPEEINAFELIVHMLQHFYMGGFGIRLLCDWVAFLEHDNSQEVIEKVCEFVEDFRVKNFVSIVTNICVRYLGLSAEKAAPFITEKVDEKMADNMLFDILQAKEFGFSNDRGMVALSDASFMGLVKGFHHQMKCNHPKTSKCVLLWPVLWVVTLVVFMRNNKRIRNVKTIDVIRKAMKRADSVNAGSLQIFKK